jgi:glycosyltransferase involved in cell wall biosynthesis
MSGGRRLRIAYVTGLTLGGSERQMLALAERLPRERFAVEFIVLGEGGANARAAEALGVPVHILGSVRRAESAMPVYAIRAAGRVADYISRVRRGRYDIVDAWLFHGYAIAGLTRPISRTPILIAGRRSLSSFKDRFGPIERAIDAIARRRADVIVANSQAVIEDVVAREGVDRRRLRLIRNGVEPARPLTEAERDAIRAGWGAGPDALVVACVANYLPNKGQAELLDVAAGLRAAVPAARYVLLGEGPLRTELEARAAALELTDIVRFGSVPDARAVIGAVDVVIQASHAEGSPNALLEAAAAGRAIVATAAGGTPEVVDEGRTGLLVPVGDEAALATALRTVLDDPGLRLRLGTAARDHVERTFPMGAMIEAYAELYEELAAARGLGR